MTTNISPAAFTTVRNDANCGHEWMTSVEAAEYLRISVKTLLNEVSLGHLPYHKLGRRNRYSKSELESVILKNRGIYYVDKT